LDWFTLMSPMSGRGRGLETAIAILLCILPLLSNPANAEGMSFRRASVAGSSICSGACDPPIVAEGEITDATPNQFLAFLRGNPPAHHGRILVFVDSLGGKIVAGIELGKIFRKIGVTAAVGRLAKSEGGGVAEPVGGDCFSACVYAFIGAKRRLVPRGSRIGIHRMFAYVGGSRKFDNGEMAAMLRRYSNMMGVSPDLIAATEQGTSDTIRILTPAQIAKWRLASPRS
jgi:hypothetical protein